MIRTLYSSDSMDDIEHNKQPQYKNIMNNIRRGIRTDDELIVQKSVCHVE